MGGGRFDFINVKKFQKQLQQLERDNDQFCEECAKELAARLLRMVKQRTPVGQYSPGSGRTGGTLRRNWTLGEIRKLEDAYTVEMINPTEYASYVEYGHRTANHEGWVPGHFMLTISEKEIQDIAPKLIEKKLETKLREVFHAE